MLAAPENFSHSLIHLFCAELQIYKIFSLIFFMCFQKLLTFDYI